MQAVQSSNLFLLFLAGAVFTLVTPMETNTRSGQINNLVSLYADPASNYNFVHFLIDKVSTASIMYLCRVMNLLTKLIY